MLQLSLVCERWPLGGGGRLRSGIAALPISWAIGIGAYFLFVNLDAMPAAERAAGLRNPGGPIAGPEFGSALTAVGLWQAVFFIALRGWPVNTITRRPARLLAGNALVIGLGALAYLVLRNLAHWQPDAISAACGCIISATLIVAMLFEGWPAARLLPAPGRVLTLALTALVALALDRALAAYAGSVRWAQAIPNEWITTAALSFIGAGIILHVGIGLRWPFAHKTHAGEPGISREPSNQSGAGSLPPSMTATGTRSSPRSHQTHVDRRRQPAVTPRPDRPRDLHRTRPHDRRE
jgi:hypothetical protein